MRLIRDEEAYFRTLSGFVQQRANGAAFMSRFRHLWQRNGAEGADKHPCDERRAAQPGQVDVDGTRLRFQKALIATGSRSQLSTIPVARLGLDALDGVIHAYPTQGEPILMAAGAYMWDRSSGWKDWLARAWVRL